ncbi:MAG: MBL fold metallo-hydrolase [Chlamydiia bacterium]|nr:MBL fold metallo-hydrolase [Chlamydiia bacterium]
MIGYCPLASGSKGNCTYFGTENTKLLIDAGLSARATEAKLAEIGVEMEDIDAILITHEHTDHILGLKVLALKKGIPVLSNQETAKGIVSQLRACPKLKIFSTGEPFEFGDLEIHPFSIHHDTLDPVAFTIQTPKHKIGICTDIGFATSVVEHQLKGCDYLILEANHEPAMVHASPRPMVYKQRVLSRHGHLSNEACGQLLSRIAHADLKHVHLAHLSQECNSPDKALSIVSETLSRYGISLPLSIAHQERISHAISFN